MEEEKKRKSKKENNKKGIVLKVFASIVIIITVLAILFFINFVRNLVIINEIIDKQAKLKDSTNYSFVSESYNSNDTNDKLRIEHYYKDGKSIMVYSSNDSKIEVWYDEETGETIYLDETKKDQTTTNSSFLLGNTLPYFEDIENKMYYALSSLIVNSNIDGRDCYRIQGLSGVSYIDKENGMVLREISGSTVIDGKNYDSITDFKDWKFDELTDEEMERPDLTGYEATNN